MVGHLHPCYGLNIKMSLNNMCIKGLIVNNAQIGVWFISIPTQSVGCFIDELILEQANRRDQSGCDSECYILFQPSSPDLSHNDMSCTALTHTAHGSGMSEQIFIPMGPIDYRMALHKSWPQTNFAFSKLFYLRHFVRETYSWLTNPQ